MVVNQALTRRKFLHAGLAGVSVVPPLVSLSAAARAAADRIVPPERGAADQRILVVVRLTGGNDGLNTVVPCGDSAYYRARPTIAIRARDVLMVDRDRGIGLHPQMQAFKAMLDDGAAGVILAAGYPGPNHSHLASQAIWHTADICDGQGCGWLDMAAEQLFARAGVRAMAPVRLTEGSLLDQLKQVAAMIRAGLPPRIYEVTLGGFDTHIDQAAVHGRCLQVFSQAMQAFYAELKRIGEADRVMALAVSEFGRSVRENATGGTGHGAAGPMFLFGPMVRQGLIGTPPSLADLDGNGDLKYRVDFRSVYAGVLEQWLEVDSRQVLGKGYRALKVLR